MTFSKLRRRIALLAARLICEQQETEYYRARIQAARLVSSERIPRNQWPTREEIRDAVRTLLADAENSQLTGQTEIERVLADPPLSNDRFRVYLQLLLPLEQTKQSIHHHPEGDALYHSLQVFVLARDQLPYDEEFLLAALLHDIGKAIDPHDHVTAGLQVLAHLITPRTAWLIEHHYNAQKLRDGTLGARAKRRLQESENYEELLLLVDCDRQGRIPGTQVPEVEEALDYIRDLEDMFGV